MRQVLIINITRMGDLIQMIPLLSRLEEEWPGVAIDLIVDKEFVHVANLIPGLRHIVTFDFQELMDDSRACVRDVVTLYQDLANWANPLLQVGYDRVINLTFNRRSAFLVKFFGCADERGMTSAQDGSFLVKNPWMKYFLDFQVYRQINRFNIVDLFALGGSKAGRFCPIRVVVPQDLQEWASHFLHVCGNPQIWVAVQVGASDVMKAWRPEYFGHMMAALSKQGNVGFVLIGTKKEESVVHEAVQVYRQAGRQGVLCEAVGKTSVPELFALLQQCHVMVTNDTGPMHMAVAVNTPVVNVSVGHVDFWETGPFGPGHWVVQPDIVCGPCGFDNVCPHHACKDFIIPEEVAKLCLHIIGRGDLPAFLSNIRVYEGGINEDHLGTFVLRVGYEPSVSAWYGNYWQRCWYEWFTGQESLQPSPSEPPPDMDALIRIWEELAPQLDILCDQAERVLRLCQQQPVPVQELKDVQESLKYGTLAMKELVTPSLAFGPLAVASIRETFNLEENTLVGMAKEHVAAYHLLRTRAQLTIEQLTQYSPGTLRRNRYAGAIG